MSCDIKYDIEIVFFPVAMGVGDHGLIDLIRILTLSVDDYKKVRYVDTSDNKVFYKKFFVFI